MVPRELLQRAVASQRAELEMGKMVPRELLGKLKEFEFGGAVIVKGVRRCGKSTLLKMMMKEKYGELFFYANFDDERLFGFESKDFEPLMQVFIEGQGNCKAVLFDEIQNIAGWELFVNRLLREGYAVFITGSNADLLSKELGTHLTGRHVDFELYPFSFREYAALKGLSLPRLQNTAQAAAIQNAFETYLAVGGMPEAAIMGSTTVLSPLLEDVLRKDIIRRYGVRKQSELKSVLRFMLWNAANRITFNSIASNFNIASANTVQKYFSYAQEAYLFFSASKFERKLKKFDKNPRKVYCIDNGIVSQNSAGIAQQQGALLENLVAVELLRRGASFYYYQNKNGSETDFVTVGGEGTARQPQSALQVCLTPTDASTAKREENALISTLEETRLKEGLILTLAHEQTNKINGKAVHYKPVWKWLLEAA